MTGQTDENGIVQTLMNIARHKQAEIIMNSCGCDARNML